MSRLRILMLSLAAVLLLLVGGVWLLPGLLDWNRYREGIATIASARVGRPVHIGGAVTLHLLPQPILTAADVSVEDDGDGIGLKARALRLRVGLGALLAGIVDPRELTLQGADLRLPWPPPGALIPQAPTWITSLRAQVEDGRIQVGALVLDHVEGTLSTDPETGTVAAAGVGQAGPRRWQFTARLTRPGRDGAAGLDISLDGQDRLRDTGGTFSGTLGPDGALSGRVAGRGPDLSQLMAGPAVPWRGDGRLSASGGLAVADELTGEIGGAPARGAVALRVTPAARLDLAIAAGRLDLDAWLPALLARPDAIRPEIPTGIDLSAEAASWAGGTLRRVRAAIDLDEDGIALREVAALLPGEGSVELSGRVSGPAPQFTGPVHLVAPDLRATLRWLVGVLPTIALDLPPAVARRAELSARAVLGRGTLDLSDLRGTLDGTTVSGSIAARAGPRPSLQAALALDRLPLEAWLPRERLPDPLRLLPTLDATLTRLRTIDSDLKLQIQDASWSTVKLGPTALELQTEAARVVLRRLESRPGGAHLTLSGQFAEGLRLTDGRLDLSLPDLAAARPFLPAIIPDALLRGPGSLTLAAAGPPDALALRTAAELADLRVEAQPVVNLSTAAAAGAVTIHHPGATRLLEILGLGGTASWLGDGSFSLVGQAALSPGRLDLTGATLATGAARLNGQLTLDRRRLTGQLSAETLPLPLIHLRSPDPLPLALASGWAAAVRIEARDVLLDLVPAVQSLSTDLTLENGLLRLNRLSARAAGGTLSGTVALDTAADPPRLTVAGTGTALSIPATQADTPVDLVAGQVDATLDLSAAGHAPAALLSTLGGTATARLRNGLLTGLDLAAAAAALSAPTPPEALDAARAALLFGNTPVDEATARLMISRGVLDGTGTLAGEAGKGTVRGNADLRTGALDLQFSLTPAVPSAPSLGLRLTGPATAPARTPELAALARWLAERPPPTP